MSDRIVEFLAERVVERIFGIPGDTIDALMESLRKQKAVHFVVMRHEEAGAFAASAQAKLTGHLSVCVGCRMVWQGDLSIASYPIDQSQRRLGFAVLVARKGIDATPEQ